MLEPAVEWARASGPPNWLFVLALLTAPRQWSTVAVDTIQERIGTS